MCSQQPDLSLIIVNDQLKTRIKLKQIRAYIEKQGKEFILTNSTNLVIKPFKSQDSVAFVQSHVMEILDDMCENLNSNAETTCSELYNCCDCGGSECGCSYCYSCNACSECRDEEEE